MSADTNNLNWNRPSASARLIDATTADIDAERVDHLLIVKAFAETLGLVETLNRLVPSEMAVKSGIIVLGLVLDTLTGRSPLYRLEEFFEGRDTELLLGEFVPASAFNDDTVGRVLDLLFETSTTDLFRIGYEGASKTRDSHSYRAFRHHLGQCLWGISG